jgi:hypothetical protein
MLGRLTAETFGLTELAGEPVVEVLKTAPGDGQSIGGVKVLIAEGWCAAHEFWWELLKRSRDTKRAGTGAVGP